MTVSSLIEAIEERAGELLPAALVMAEQNRHRLHAWRTCSCSYCGIKREATDSIGRLVGPHASHTMREHRSSGMISLHGSIDLIREDLRQIYRDKLAIESDRIV